jgi:hypothetical protein
VGLEVLLMSASAAAEQQQQLHRPLWVAESAHACSRNNSRLLERHLQLLGLGQLLVQMQQQQAALQGNEQQQQQRAAVRAC